MKSNMRNLNLKEETKELLKENNKTLKDIIWFGCDKVELVGDLEKVLDFQYDNDFGSQEVLEDLILVGKDFWLERHEYDGSEWWEYKNMPTRPKIKVELGLRNLKVDENAEKIYDDEDWSSLVKTKDLLIKENKNNG
jgi:hypothetical protein